MTRWPRGPFITIPLIVIVMSISVSVGNAVHIVSSAYEPEIISSQEYFKNNSSISIKGLRSQDSFSIRVQEGVFYDEEIFSLIAFQSVFRSGTIQ